MELMVGRFVDLSSPSSLSMDGLRYNFQHVYAFMVQSLSRHPTKNMFMGEKHNKNVGGIANIKVLGKRNS